MMEVISIKELEQLVERNSGSEYIRSCATNLIKMRSLFMQKEKSPILELFKNAYVLLVKHFMEKVADYEILKQIDTEDSHNQRYTILQDMDESIFQFWRMLEEESQSLWNANRLINPINPGLTTISYVAPKLYLYYSEMLDQLASIYTCCEAEETDAEYAFCVNPTQEMKYRISLLFESREKHGKVCLIYIPENRTAKVRMNQFILLHELFHVLPITAREREERNNIIQWILQMLLPQMIGNTQEQVLLIKYLLEHIIKHNKKERIKNKRSEYSNAATKRIKEDWMDYLGILCGDIKDETDLHWAEMIGMEREYIINKNEEDWDTIIDYIEQPMMEEDTKEIVQTINETLTDNTLEYVIKILMSTFREGFADLYAILTMGCTPKEYYQWVEEELTEAIMDNIEDAIEERLRCIIVSTVIKRLIEGERQAFFNIDFIREWEKVFDLDVDLRDIKLYQVSKELFFQAPENSQELWQLIITEEEITDTICSYFMLCAENWIKYHSQYATDFVKHQNSFYLKGSERKIKDTTTKSDLDILYQIMGIIKTEG